MVREYQPNSPHSITPLIPFFEIGGVTGKLKHLEDIGSMQRTTNALPDTGGTGDPFMGRGPVIELFKRGRHSVVQEQK